jgi:hypothetical protein
MSTKESRLMQKRNNPSLKARLLRGAFYVLLAVCAIPFAWAQRNATNSSVATANLSSLTAAALSASGAAETQLSIPPVPGFPQVVLYDQYDNAGTAVTLSATFNDLPIINSDCADDFVVPTGQTWNVQSIDADGAYFNGPGPADSFSVFFYTDSAGFPGTQVYSATNQPWTQNGSTFTVNLPSQAVLTPGTYWVEIQANILSASCCEWGWTDRTITSGNAAAWQNPSGFFGACQSWSRRGATCDLDPSEPDQVYRLNGTITGATPTPTATATPTATPTATSTPTATATPRPIPSPRPRPIPYPRPAP